jgi:hypothetical protein
MVFASADGTTDCRANHGCANRVAHIGPHAVSFCAPNAVSNTLTDCNPHLHANTPSHDDDSNTGANTPAYGCPHGSTNCTPNVGPNRQAYKVSHCKANHITYGITNCATHGTSNPSTHSRTHQVANCWPNIVAHCKANSGTISPSNAGPHGSTDKCTHSVTDCGSNHVSYRGAHTIANVVL